MTPGLLSLVYRHLVSRRLRTLLTALAIALGTGVITATFTTNSAIERSLERTAVVMLGNADLIVEAPDPRGFQAAVLPAVGSLPGVKLVAPRVQKRAFFRTATQKGFVELLGIDPVLDPQIYSYRLVSGDFLPPEISRNILVGQTWAERLGVKAGDSLDLISKDGFTPFTVVGVIEEAGLGQGSSGGIIFVHIQVAQATFGLGERVQQLSIQVSDPGRLPDLEGRLPAVLGREYVVRRVAEVAQELKASVVDFQRLLLFFGGIALFVGAFLVYNTMAMTVVEQTREIGLLRAVGTSMNQVMAMKMAQAAILGVGGAVPGLVLGQLLALALVRWVEVTRQLSPMALPLSLTGMLLGMGIGLLMTLLAALIPAWRAGRLSPLAAVNAIDVPRMGRGHNIRRSLALIGLAGLLIFLMWPVAEETRAPKALSLFPLFLLLVYLSPAYIDPLIWLGGMPFRRWSGGLGVMALQNVQREKGRASITVAGFFVSLAFIVALTNLRDSATTAGQQWVQSLFPGEIVVVSPVPQPQVLLDEFASLPNVEKVSPIVLHPVIWGSTRLTAIAIDLDHYFSAFQFLEGDRITAFDALRQGDALLVPSRLSREWGIGPGASMRLRIGDTEAEFTVVGVLAHSLPSIDDYGALVLSSQALKRYSEEDAFQFLAVSARPNAVPETVLGQVRQLAEQYGMEANSVQSLQLSVHQALQQLLILFGGLVVTGLLVGSLGMVNTMMMNVIQRGREIGILRAVGMTQMQVQLLTVIEGAILGFIGAVMGIAAGGFLTWLMVELSRTSDFDPQFSFSPWVVAVTLVVGVVTAVVAAFYPAHRAAQVKIVAAVQYE